MSHNFFPSIKKGVSYCSSCGCLSYKNIISKSITSNNNHNLMKIDPLILRYKPISLKLDYSLMSHKRYIENRQRGLSKIYNLSNTFHIEKKITFKAIGLMDQIFLNNNELPIENIEIMASICLLLSYEFNNCCNISNKVSSNQTLSSDNCSINNFHINKSFYDISNIKGLYQYIKKEINNIMYWEVFCLKYLDYNLGRFTAFDYINLFFELGIIFTKEHVDIINKYQNCLNILDIIINQYNICRYNQYVIALSIIFIIFNNDKNFDQKAFKYIYGVNFSKKKYKSCVNEIYIMINNLYHINKVESLFNNYYINNGIRSFNFDNLKYPINNNYINNKNNINIIKNYINNTSIKELFIKYIFLFGKCKINNFMNFPNNLQNDFNNYSSFNFSDVQINELFETITQLYEYNCKSNNSYLYNEERKNVLNIKETNFKINSNHL